MYLFVYLFIHLFIHSFISQINQSVRIQCPQGLVLCHRVSSNLDTTLCPFPSCDLLRVLSILEGRLVSRVGWGFRVPIFSFGWRLRLECRFQSAVTRQSMYTFPPPSQRLLTLLIYHHHHHYHQLTPPPKPPTSAPHSTPIPPTKPSPSSPPISPPLTIHPRRLETRDARPDITIYCNPKSPLPTI